jgi:acetoacetate decarboxylase
MKHETVRASAFAMPLTNPAFPAGPYRYEFGLSAMRAHWQSGLDDIRRTLADQCENNLSTTVIRSAVIHIHASLSGHRR